MVDAHDGETYTSEGSRLIWIDCEMTGLDIFGGDELVEVSVVPTDFDLNVLDEGVDYVIKPSQKAVDHMNDFVRAMHTRSGLINEWEHGLSLEEAERKVTEYVLRFTPDGVRPLVSGRLPQPSAEERRPPRARRHHRIARRTALLPQGVHGPGARSERSGGEGHRL